MFLNALNSPQQYIAEINRLIGMGQTDLAQFIAAKFVTDFAANTMASVIMARVLLRNNQVAQALRYIELAQATISRKSTWSDVLSVSVTLQTLGEDEQARRVLDFLDIESPISKPALLEVATQFSNVGDQLESLRWIDYAKTQGHSGFSVNHLHGKVLTYTGPVELAANVLEEALIHQPNSGSAHWSLSVLDIAEGRSVRIQRMQSIHKQGGLERLDEQFLNYALFRELDKQGEIHAAWRYLESASIQRRKEVQYDAAQESNEFDALIEATKNLATYDDVLSSVNKSPTPIFIIGMPRTGTTLLERMLGNYKDLQPCGELTVIRNQLQLLANKGFAHPFDTSFANVLKSIDLSLLGSRYIEKTHWLRNERPYFTDKHPINFNFAGVIAKALPNAKIIHLMRNPMDTCFSNLKEFFGPVHYTYSYRQDELASHYKNYRKLMTHWHEIVPGRILDVQYENLVLQPDIEAERVRMFCGLPKQEGLTDISQNKHVTTTASTIQLREPVHTRNIQAWIRYSEYLKELATLLDLEQNEYQQSLLNSRKN
jgi:Sulfotransferase family